MSKDTTTTQRHALVEDLKAIDVKRLAREVGTWIQPATGKMCPLGCLVIDHGLGTEANLLRASKGGAGVLTHAMLVTQLADYYNWPVHGIRALYREYDTVLQTIENLQRFSPEAVKAALQAMIEAATRIAERLDADEGARS